ncbi:sulfotransferase family 2 domain-containing protein [Salipiger mangrovisoli]|uniref:Sulfotransferase family 2 domain-containing protein n=1 Tax=Salipiger mangrovisoli TaxID=2865933 RepID=A0ABR9X0I5_9RHOB|nr:sulfotransferase family 2 domain-containing protein [Salipiger mangrovisoli]MBE9637056.1 sulfotransferase family 2 domain-containing protein [Salipiger mangrovisoli]
MMNSTPRHRCVFFHLPKCGGTSLSEAMYATVPFNHRLGVLDAVATRRAAAILQFDKDDAQLCHEDLDHGQSVFDLREGMLLQHMAWDTMLIHGHVLWSERAMRHFGKAYRYVTIMRDPVARTISNMRMAQRAGIIGDDLEAYVEGPVARRQARVFLRYLAGRNDIPEEEVPAATELAMARLDDFALIGFLDRQDAFVKRYGEVFGVPLRIAKLNVAPDRKPDYPEPVMQRIRELCAPDIALYERAQKVSAACV